MYKQLFTIILVLASLLPTNIWAQTATAGDETKHRVIIMSYGIDESDPTGATVYGRTYCQQSGIADGYGQFDGAFDFEIVEGSDVTMTFEPSSGCKVDSLVIRRNGMTSSDTETITTGIGSTYTITNVQTEVSVGVYYGIGAMETAAAPTFSWSGDTLTLSTTTEGAYITYTLTETTGELSDSALYINPLEIKRDVLIKAFAGKIGMAESETVSLDYPYTAWTSLLAAVADAQAAITGNANVSADALAALQAQVGIANEAYAARTATADEVTGITTTLQQLTETVNLQVSSVIEADYVLVCDELGQRPGRGVLFGDNHFIDVTGGTVSNNKGQIDLSVVDTLGVANSPLYVTEDIVAKYSQYGAHDNFLRLKNAQDVISMKVKANTRLIFYYEGNKKSGAEARIPLLSENKDLSNPLNDAPTSDYPTTGTISRYDFIVPRDMQLYVGSYNGDIYVSYIIAEIDYVASEPYAVLSEDSLTVTFFYDDQKTARGGIDINSSYVYYESTSPYGTATTAVFDTSFASYWPTSTAYWFHACQNLTNILGIENLNTAIVTNMCFMFEFCDALTNIDLSGFNTGNVTDMHNMFRSCSSLTSLDVSGFNTGNVTDMSNMFSDCSALTALDVSGFNTVNVTTMESMFQRCSGLTSLDLSSFNTTNVTDMNGMFGGCSGLSTIYVGNNWSTDSVTDGAVMFSGSTSLVGGLGTVYDGDHVDYTYAHIDGGTANPGYLTDINSLVRPEIFAVETNSLVTVGTPVQHTPSVIMTLGADTWSTQYSMGEAWVNPLDFSSDIYYPNYYESFIQTLTGSMVGANNPKDGPLEGDVTTGNGYKPTQKNLPQSGGYVVFEPLQDGSLIVPIRVFAGKPLFVVDGSGKAIYDFQFKTADGQTISMTAEPAYTLVNSEGENIDFTGFVSLNVEANHQYYVFSTGSKPRFGGYIFSPYPIDIDPATTEAVRDLENVVASEPYAILIENTLTFYYDKQKQERNGMSVGPFGTQGERGWEGHNDDITRVVFDESFAQDTTITSTAWWFTSMQNLTTIDGISYLNTQNVSNMQYMFSGCSSLASLDVTGFRTQNVTNMNYMFSNCSGLTNLDLSGFNTQNVTEMGGMFHACSSLTTIFVGNDWTTAALAQPGTEVFAGCTALIGGMGTTYNFEYVDANYAHIDGGTANPGYLTPKNGYGAAATPTFTRVNDNKVLVSSETEGAIIRYTLDGTEPDSTSTVYSDSIGVDRNLTIKAYAARQNFTDSEVGTYTVDWFKVSDVEFVQTGNQVALSTATPDADIHYTLSTETGAPEHDYDGTPLTMSGDCIITAWATLEGYTPSEQTEFEFHADGVTCSNPVFARNGNVIKITTVTEQVQIFYTTNGTEPTEQSTLYADSILVDHNMVIKAIAMRQNYYPSQVISFTVDWFKADMPTFLWTNDQLSLSTATEGGDIYYTIAANASSVSAPQQYSGAITVTQDAVITAWTQRQGWNNSDTLVIDYPYTAWVALLDAVNAAKDVIVLATGNDNVPQQMLNELQAFVGEAEAMYQARTAARTDVENVTGSLNEQTAAVNQLATAVDEAYAVLTENNTVLTFYYDKKMQERNGMGVGPFSTEVERGWSTDPSAITTVVFDETFAGYTALSSTAYWFEHCSNLSTIIGLPSLNTANVTDMSYMFDGCSVLASIDVSNFNTSKVTDMSRMFSSCYALQTLNLSSFNTLNVTSMKDLFAGCSSLASVNLSSFTTTNVSDMHSMFYGCTALQSLDLTSFNTAIVIDMENMFANSYSLNTIYVSGDWNTDAVSNGSSMFTDCITLVGGRGTVYDANHTDAAYARIDMAPDAPGYFTRKTQQMGDANDDGAVTVEDAVATVTNILGEPTVSYFSQTKADMNNDSLIDIFDVTLIVNAVFAATPAPAYSMAGSIAAEDVRLTAQSNRMYMGIDKEGRFTAFQFDVTLPEGTELEGVSLASASTNHQLSFQKRQGNTYRVIGLSMTNEQLAAANGRLVQLQLSDNAGEKNVKMSNVIFVGQPATDATAIRNYVSDGAADRNAIYDLNGRYVGTDKSRLTKGIYIINHKKVNIK